MCDIFYLEYTVAKNICVISGISFLIRIIFVQYNLLSVYCPFESSKHVKVSTRRVFHRFFPKRFESFRVAPGGFG